MSIAKNLLMESLTLENTNDFGGKYLNDFLEELIPLIQNQR